MKQITAEEFLAIADELSEIETEDQYFTIYIKKTDDLILFYKKYDDGGDPSYFYMFTLLKNSLNNIGTTLGTELYNEQFNVK